MTPINIALLIVGVAAGMLIMVLVYYSRCKAVLKTTASIDEGIGELSEDIYRIKRRLAVNSCFPIRYFKVKTNSFVDVAVVYRTIDGEAEERFVIKRFDFKDDSDFALLEAQELLDHLNGK